MHARRMMMIPNQSVVVLCTLKPLPNKAKQLSSLFGVSRLDTPMWSQLTTFSATTIGHEDLREISSLAKLLEIPVRTVLSRIVPVLLRVRGLPISDASPSKKSNHPISTNSQGRRVSILPTSKELLLEIYGSGNPESTSLSNFITSLHRLQRSRLKCYEHDAVPGYRSRMKRQWIFSSLLMTHISYHTLHRSTPMRSRKVRFCTRKSHIQAQQNRISTFAR